jgi:hypothetical protein
MAVRINPRPDWQLPPPPPENLPAAGVVTRGRRQAEALVRAVMPDRPLACGVTLLAPGGYRFHDMTMSVLAETGAITRTLS